MKKFSLFMLALFVTLQVGAQTKLSAQQQNQIISKIESTAAATKSMQCQFTQTKSMKMLSKKMVSKGVMYFKQGNKLRWQYTSPYDYTFLLNGDKAMLKSAKTTQYINAKNNKIFRQVNDIVMKSVMGSGLRKSNDFSFEMYRTGNQVWARLLPKKKELKQVYTSIEIYLNPEQTLVTSVKMMEKTGDVTVVNLQNVKTNIAIDEKVFAIH